MGESRLDYYKPLLDFTYDELVDYLLIEHKEVKDNYFNQVSYEQKLKSKDKIKQISKGNYAKSSEGLYCHHIYENEEPSLSHPPTLWEKQLPYKYQEKEHLVYCDLIEHVILHALIAREYSSQLENKGYHSLCGIVKKWYIDIKPPSNSKKGNNGNKGNEWELNGYYKSFLKPDEATVLLEYIEQKRLR